MKWLMYTVALFLAASLSVDAQEKKYDDVNAGIHITYPHDWTGPIELARNIAFRSPEGLTLLIGTFPGDAGLLENKRGIYDSFLSGKSEKIEAPVKLETPDKELTCIKARLPAKSNDIAIPDMYSCLAINKSRCYLLSLAGPAGLASIGHPVFVKAIQAVLGIEP